MRFFYNIAGFDVVPESIFLLPAGNAAVINALVGAGAHLEALTDVGTPLLWAAGSGSVDAVAALLAAGASPSARADGDVTAVFMATASGASLEYRVLGQGL